MLLAIGAMALFLGKSDVTLSYVRSGIRPLLGAGGAVLLALGLAAAFGPVRGPLTPRGRATPPPPPPSAPEGATGPGAHGPRVAWLLVLPLLVLILVQPPALGSYAASRRAAPTAARGGNDDPLPPLGQAVDGAVPMALSEFFYRALYDERHSLEGVRVRLLGFVTHGRDSGGAYLLARFSMYCCAADAEVVEVAVRGDTTARAADQWLMVEGHWQPTASRKGTEPGVDEPVPVLVADSVTPVAPPRDHYEHSLFGF